MEYSRFCTHLASISSALPVAALEASPHPRQAVDATGAKVALRDMREVRACGGVGALLAAFASIPASRSGDDRLSFMDFKDHAASGLSATPVQVGLMAGGGCVQGGWGGRGEGAGGGYGWGITLRLGSA